jgi:Cu-Zn family superoxide dismutase
MGLAIAPLVWIGGSTARAAASHEYPVIKAQAQLYDGQGRFRGVAVLWQGSGGVSVTVDLQGMDAGAYGIHVHETGKCDKPRFESAGAHWNPKGRRHGSLNRRGAHRGDMANVTVPTGEQGYQFEIRKARLASGDFPMLDSDGAALVIHAEPDDYKTDPSGNSGERMVCGAIEPIHP